MSFDIKKIRIGVVGLGYVGLPLAVEFGKKYPTVGFDVNEARVAELRSGKDSTLEVTSSDLAAAEQLEYSATADALAKCNFYIVTVPTPVGSDNRPILTPLRSASETLAKVSHPEMSLSTSRRCIRGPPRNTVFRILSRAPA